MNNQRKNLLGQLPHQGPGARGIERIARNPRCERLATLYASGAQPAQVARQVYDIPVEVDLSPFASARGGRFEFALFANNCERLLEKYHEMGLLPKDAQAADLEFMVAKYPDPAAARLQKTEEILLARAQGQVTPDILIKPRLQIELAGEIFETEPDALVAQDQFTYRVAEIKSYAHRAALTDNDKTGSACRQAAVGLLAYQNLLQQAGVEAPISPVCDLIFAKLGSNWPELTQMDIRGELENITGTLQGLDGVLTRSTEKLHGRTLDQAEALESIPNNPCADCASHCPLWTRCRSDLMDTPAWLSDGAVDDLAGVDSLQAIIAAVQAEVPEELPQQIQTVWQVNQS